MSKENKYINVQTGEVLDLIVLKSMKSNTLLKHRIDLWCEWDFEKNEELGLDIYKVTKGSDKVAWWICPKCKSKYDRKIEIRSRGQNCPYCTGRRVNHTNSLASLNPKIAKQWHPSKNGDLTPNKVTCNKGISVWWRCFDCKSEYEQTIDKKTNGRGCPYCSGYKINHTNSLASLRPDLASEWHTIKNGNLTPHEIGCGSGQKAWWVCKANKTHEWNTSVNNRNNGTDCPYCTHNPKILKGYNDLWTTNPEIASLLLDASDGYKYTKGSNIKIKWKCPDCEHINTNNLVDVCNGSRCKKCSDVLSFGEKIIYTLLDFKQYDFEYEKSFEWSQGKRYDFYLPSRNMIIEIHGLQHYGRGFEYTGGRTLEEEQKNDRLKELLARENGIEQYVVIDARKSDFGFIKSNILNSEISSLLNVVPNDFSNMKIKHNNITISSWELWEKGFGIMDISRKLKVSKNMVRKSLNLGISLRKIKSS